MKNEITVHEVGWVFWVVFADSLELASNRSFEDADKARKYAEKHAAKYGYEVRA